MNEHILDFISQKRVGVLAVEMLDGSPHAATVHFAHVENPLLFFFETERAYRKSEPLFGRQLTRATFVIGTDESATKTLQLDGQARLITESEKDLYDSTYFGKFPEKKAKSVNNPNFVFFVFIPDWWRFTEWTKEKGKLILSSED